MLRDKLKSKIDRLSEEQLSLISELIEQLEVQSQQTPKAVSNPESSKDKAAAAERLQRFREWIVSRLHTGISLPDEAFDRGTIYD